MTRKKIGGIVHDNATHYVWCGTHGYEVYRNGATAATRCATYGYGLKDAAARAVADADRRHAELKKEFPQ